ncbi:MAG: serine hydrolase, partial [Bacillota bacterium]|nr:serine hydrolase [Bacillota bacterium]
MKYFEKLVSSFSGTFGLYARHLRSGEVLEFNADERFPTASCTKVPILIEVWKQALDGRFSLDDQMVLTSENVTTGTGVLLDLTPGLKMSVRDVALLMIVVSDNVATNMLIDLVG